MREVLIEIVTNHTPFDDTERAHTVSTLEFLHKNKNCTSAENLKGHITASAWVLSPDHKETLLTHHKKLNRWLQLGGHIEDDATIQEAALREAVEESGIENIHLIRDSIFDIDVHFIPARNEVAEHYHYDIRFLFQAERTDFVISDESNDLAWAKLTDIGNFVGEESVLRMCRKSEQVDAL
ncbi:MAG: NUDIX hydrolase [Planctomycetes bacterium]|nr:NUDIX hydrolase [Planctomycetota bacterium]